MGKWIIAVLALLVIGPLAAYDDSPDCINDITSTFFNETFLFEAMSYHYVQQSSWKMIARDINYRQSTFSKQIQAIRERISPDPFENPFDGHAAWEVVRQMLLQNFREVMNFYQIFNESDIKAMFQYLENKQKAKIIRCFKLDQPINLKK